MNAFIDISNTVLMTERLTLRPFRESDLDDFYEYASVDGVGQMAGWLPHKNRDESKKILDMFIAGKKTFAVEYEGKVIGSLGIEEYDEAKFPSLELPKCREIGYVLSKDYWGHGLMPEAVMRVIAYLFDDIGLDAILCGHFTRNAQSARVQEKCGFTYFADHEYRTRYGVTEQCKINILTKEQYKSRR